MPTPIPTRDPETAWYFPLASELPPCPEGYSNSGLDEKACFKIYCEEKLDLQAAKEKCKADGGTLAVIENDAQNEFVRKLKAECKLPWVLIGLTSQGSKDDSCWYWAGRTSFTDYANWDEGQPRNDGKDEDCVGMGMHGQPDAGKWHDCDCTTLCADEGRLPGLERRSTSNSFLHDHPFTFGPFLSVSTPNCKQ